MVGSDPEPIPAPCFNNTDGYNEFLFKKSLGQVISRLCPSISSSMKKKFFELKLKLLVLIK